MIDHERRLMSLWNQIRSRVYPALFRAQWASKLIRRLHRVGDESPATLALSWFSSHEEKDGGILVHSLHAKAYPEVTGYIIPTLLDYGERDLALRLVRWLMRIQRPDGAFADPDAGRAYVFDTGQALRGLLACSDRQPGVLKSIQMAAEYLCTRALEDGRRGFQSQYNSHDTQKVPESIHLYVLSPLMGASAVLGVRKYEEVAKHCLEFYSRHPSALRTITLTHFLAYELEALIDLGCPELAIPILAQLEASQKTDGSIPAHDGAAWICTPGLAQLAICFYKIGKWEPADRSLAWLERHQQPGGGFLGSYGPGSAYFPNCEPSWATKYYLDAHRLRVRSFVDRHAHKYPTELSPLDGRAQAVLGHIRSGDDVLEVGCGKGRFLKLIKSAFRDAKCTGVDLSTTMLNALPSDIKGLEGSLESVPCPDSSYDVSFSVEAIEHSANPKAAIAELIRVTKPGGCVIVIDKQREHWGRLECPPWERWYGAAQLKELLAQGCEPVVCEPVGYDGHPADGLMLMWKGRKTLRDSDRQPDSPTAE
jgi:malonyl-CoA O-methyltransferase